MSAGVGVWEREVKRGWSVGSTVGSGEGKLHLVFCYRARDKTEDLGLGEQRKRRMSLGNLPGMACGLAGKSICLF